MSLKRPQTFYQPPNHYDLSHMSCFISETVTLHRPEGVSVLCTFAHHCFTTADLVNPNYTMEGEQRSFCTYRHADSLKLPDLIKQSLISCQQKRIYQSKDKNGAIKLLLLDDPNSPASYFVYFDLTRSKTPYADIKMTISSAFKKNQGVPRDHAKLATELDRSLGLLPSRKSKKKRKK